MLGNGLTVVVSTAIVAYGLTWGTRKLAPQLKLMDQPDGGRKRHRRATPLMGGVAVTAAWCAAAVVCGVANGWQDPWWLGLIGSTVLYCGLGLWDDRFDMPASRKFAGQVLASVPFAVSFGPVATGTLFGWSVPIAPWSFLLVVGWMVCCTNVVNLSDGLDGAASSLGIIACLAASAMALSGGNDRLVLLAACGAAAVAGFAVHNFPPARTFLGDAGSLAIGCLAGGFLLAACTSSGEVRIVPASIALAVPAFDAGMAILRRKLNGQSIGQADRGHIHHLLKDRGLTTRQTLLTLASLHLAVALVAVSGCLVGSDGITVTLCTMLLGLLVAGRVFGHRELALLRQRLAAPAANQTAAARAAAPVDPLHSAPDVVSFPGGRTADAEGDDEQRRAA